MLLLYELHCKAYSSLPLSSSEEDNGTTQASPLCLKQRCIMLMDSAVALQRILVQIKALSSAAADIQVVQADGHYM